MRSQYRALHYSASPGKMESWKQTEVAYTVGQIEARPSVSQGCRRLKMFNKLNESDIPSVG